MLYIQEYKIKKTFGDIMWRIKDSGSKITLKVTIPQSPPTIRREVTEKRGKNPRHIHINIAKWMRKIRNGE